MKDVVNFTKEDLDRLIVAYKEALEQGKEEFVFDEHVLLVSYARYLIEYLEFKFVN